MAGSAINPNVVRFGLFELDLRAGELRKAGIKIKLQDQPFQILAMLLERPGEIVTREELQKRLWPQDTFVDFDLSLNSAVKKLRQTLGDDSENLRFIETLYRRGYRFIGQVNGVAAALEPVSVSPTASQARGSPEPLPPKARGRSFRLLAWAIPAFSSSLLQWFGCRGPRRHLESPVTRKSPMMVCAKKPWSQMASGCISWNCKAIILSLPKFQ